MIHEEICTYEVCKLAKEKGFNWICPHYFRLNNKDLFMIFPCEDWSDIEERINAPTQSLLQRWLREEKALHIQITLWEKGWYSDIWAFEYYEEEKEYAAKMLHQSPDFPTYELALEDALKYALENLV